MRLYLAGPMTGIEEWNFPAFNAAAATLRAAGHDVVNPVEIESDTTGQWADYLRKDIPQLLTCEGIALLPGWQDSRGARLELHIAHELGLHKMFLSGANPVRLTTKEVARA